MVPATLGVIIFTVTLLLLASQRTAANVVVFLDPNPKAPVDAGFEKGTPSSLANSALVARLDLEDKNNKDDKVAIAKMMMEDIKANMEKIFVFEDLGLFGKMKKNPNPSPYWITFVTSIPVPKEGEKELKIDFTVDFAGVVVSKNDPSRLGQTAPKKDVNKPVVKSWVFVDKLADANKKIWFHDKNGKAQDRALNKEEATNALSQVAAHELGHLLGFGGHTGNVKDKNLDSKLPTDTEMIKPDTGAGKEFKAALPTATMMTSGGIRPNLTFQDGNKTRYVNFTKNQQKKLKNKIGLASDLNHVGAKKEKKATKGDKDIYGTSPSGGDGSLESIDLLDHPTIDPSLIVNPDGDGTDVLLPEGITSFTLQFADPDVGIMVSAAFFELEMYNWKGDGLTIQFDGVDVTSQLDLFFAPDLGVVVPDGLTAEYLFDLELHMSLAELESMLADGEVQVDLQVLPGFGQTFAVDSLETTVYMVPEPATSTLLGFSGLMLFRRKQRVA